MRTLASTFSTRAEAEAASRRLEAIGLSPDRITLKDVADSGNGAGGVFISVKVTTEQVEPVSGILKGGGAGSSTAPLVNRPRNEAIPRPEPVTEPSFRPLPNNYEDLGPASPPSDSPRSRPRPAGEERARIGRYVIFYCLALVAAFVIGAWLGLLS